VEKNSLDKETKFYLSQMEKMALSSKSFRKGKLEKKRLKPSKNSEVALSLHKSEEDPVKSFKTQQQLAAPSASGDEPTVSNQLNQGTETNSKFLDTLLEGQQQAAKPKEYYDENEGS
jgi:hypothetical protein